MRVQILAEETAEQLNHCETKNQPELRAGLTKLKKKQCNSFSSKLDFNHVFSFIRSFNQKKEKSYKRTHSGNFTHLYYNIPIETPKTRGCNFQFL